LCGDRSILVYAYILIYCFKELGFENEGFEVERVFLTPDYDIRGPLPKTGRDEGVISKRRGHSFC
jgi:hypothetical protein